MGTQPMLGASAAGEFALALFAQPEVSSRARVIGDRVAELLPGCGVVVYAADSLLINSWQPRWSCGGVSAEAAIAPDSGTLGGMLDRRAACVFAGAELPREAYEHLNVRRSVAAIACVPLSFRETIVGAIEVVSFDRPITASDLDTLKLVAEYAGPALAAAIRYEDERNATLHSITRLSQLYDLEKVFNSTLEMDELLPVIATKVQDVLSVGAVHLWMVGGGDELVLMARAGDDPTIEDDAVQNPGDGVAAEVSDKGESLLVPVGDERLTLRNAGFDAAPVRSVMAVPLVHQGKLVGVLEAVNRADGTSFTDDDLFFLTSVGETTANALQNASLLQAERKVEVLQTLVHVSREITSTLNVDRVMHAIVNGPNAVIPYERATIALDHGGRVQLKAISGEEHFNPSDDDVKRLGELLNVVALSPDDVAVTELDGELKGAPPHAENRFKEYFQQSGMRAFHAIPLSDDEGRVGLLTLESRDPEFLSNTMLEMIRVLAAQATVALRNAQLYREVPFISVLEPLIQRKQRFMALRRRRRIALVGAALAVLLLLAIVPFPLRVQGDATVGPVHKAQIQPETDGVIRSVNVKEGDFVHRGDVLAEMEDWDSRSTLAAAQAKYQTAMAQMSRSLATNDGTEAGIQRAQANYWAAEVERASQMVRRRQLRAPIDGWVTTPHVDTFAGRHLKAGDLFAEVEDNTRATVDVGVDEGELALLRAGDSALVKLDGYPTRTFKGRVAIVSPKGEVVGNDRVFFARVDVPNSERLMRPGLQGRSKISVGWHPVGYVLLRKPARWLYTTFWNWFGW